MGLHSIVQQIWAGIPTVGMICCWLLFSSSGSFLPITEASNASVSSAEVRKPGMHPALHQETDNPEWAADRPLTKDASRLARKNHQEGYEQTDEQIPLVISRPIWRF